MVLLLENDAYKDDPKMRAVPYTQGIQYKAKPYLQIGYHDGLFGFRILKGFRMSKTKDLRPEPDELPVVVNELIGLSDSTEVNVEDTIPLVQDTLPILDSLATDSTMTTGSLH